MPAFMGNPFANLPTGGAPVAQGGAPLPAGLMGGTLPLNLTPSPITAGAPAPPVSSAVGGALSRGVPVSGLPDRGIGSPGIPGSGGGMPAAQAPAAQQFMPMPPEVQEMAAQYAAMRSPVAGWVPPVFDPWAFLMATTRGGWSGTQGGGGGSSAGADAANAAGAAENASSTT